MLKVLGVDDYGVYAVVGGIVTFMNFLNSSMSGASSRFITYELGKGNSDKLRDTFSSSILVHAGVAVAMIVVMETAGLWYVNTKLSLPTGTLTAANWVFQFSILASALSITQVPYSACLIAHERMGVYAYIEILNVVLKLIIVYVLLLWDVNKLILYGALVLAVQTIIVTINRVYCVRQFKECKFKIVYKKDILRSMLSFSGWDLYGNMCVSARMQGINLILNAFYGTVINTAAGIASTVNGIILGLSNNILVAFRPRVVKSFATDDISSSLKYTYKSVKYSQIFLAAVFIPILVRIPYVINLWLGEIPEYVVGIIRIIIFSTMINMINRGIVTIVHATGNIKLISFVTGTCYLIALPFSYLALKEGYEPYTVFVVLLINDLIILSSNLVITKHLVPLFSVGHLLVLICKLALTFIAGFAVAYYLHSLLPDNLVGLILICLSSSIVLAIVSYIILLNSDEKDYLIQKLLHII